MTKQPTYTNCARISLTDPFSSIFGLAMLLFAFVDAFGGRRARKTRALPPRRPRRRVRASVTTTTELMALDQENWKRPQSAFKWIAMARDIKVPWDTFGTTGMDDG